MSTLDSLLETTARSPQLLIASDYDGTIAPLVDDPMTARPRRETVAALRTLAELPQTHVAVISGRALADLAVLSRLPEEIHLVGSHGSEFDAGFSRAIPADVRAAVASVEERLTPLLGRYPGSVIEPKPAGLSFHHRAVDPAVRSDLDAELAEIGAEIDGLTVRQARQVVEFQAGDHDKGRALERLRSQVGASSVIFLGDDVSDEAAFAALQGPDLAIKVGPGDTIAPHRLESPDDVARLLARLAELRSEWLLADAMVPIEAHSLLSDHRTAAMVTPDARITWFCAPRIDSGAVFAELLDDPAAGHFSVGPLGSSAADVPHQAYVGDTMLLETSWAGVSVLDYLDCARGRSQRVAGRSDLIRVLSGNGRAWIEFAPRLDFGRFPTRLETVDDGLVIAGAADLMALRAHGVEWTIVEQGPHQTARAEVDLSAGDVTLEFRCGTASVKPDVSPEADRRSATADHWTKWVSRLELAELSDEVRPDLVRRSALVLKSLCHTPTGAIVAAPTTSLPETIGGIRNWDYRYCWLRDAAFTAASLVRLGSHGEAMAYLDWVLDIVDGRDEPERLQPLYLVTGRHLPPEAEIAELAGYAGSRPVRIGNAAERQVQLDVFGPIVALIELLASRGEPLAAPHWRLVQAMVTAVERRWTEPDNGIWEIRAAPRHHVYSKTMCWVTVDRAIAAAAHLGTERPEWRRLADEIRDEVLERGWNPERRSFTSAYGSTDLDASVLAIGTYGLIDPADERFAATVDAIRDELGSGPTVYRYLSDDGLPGAEGGFHLMTSWLVDSLRLTGRRSEALELYQALADLAGPTLLLPEEWDPATGRSLGNHPQAYSHLGVIDNALGLAQH